MTVNALDPELPSLASDAAVELDLLINGEPTDLGAVRQLGERLRHTIDKSSSDPSARGLHVDTATETILGQAFMRSGDDPATILSKLVERTKQISDLLSSAKDEAEKSQLELQRAFCLALSKSAAAYRQMLLDVRPSHPYRR